MARGQLKQKMEWTDPALEYIYSDKESSVRSLSEKWKGNRGCSFGRLIVRCREENWVEKRKKHRQKAYEEMARQLDRERADNDVQLIRERIRDHRTIGEQAQRLGKLFGTLGVASKLIDPKTGKPIPGATDDMRITDAGRTAARLMKDGVDIERKALGLVDKHIAVLDMGRMAEMVLNVIGKYITDPVLYENMVKDLMEQVEQEQKVIGDLMLEG